MATSEQQSGNKNEEQRKTVGQRFDQFMGRVLNYSPVLAQRLIAAKERNQIIRRTMFRAPRDGRR